MTRKLTIVAAADILPDERCRYFGSFADAGMALDRGYDEQDLPAVSLPTRTAVAALVARGPISTLNAPSDPRRHEVWVGAYDHAYEAAWAWVADVAVSLDDRIKRAASRAADVADAKLAEWCKRFEETTP